MTATHDAAPHTSGAAPVRYRLALPVRTELINANQRPSPREKARLVKQIRHTTWWMARYEKLPQLQRAHILYVVHPEPTTRRRDPGNWAPSAKAAVDGLVDAGILPDDNHTRVLGPDPRLGRPVAGSQLVLHITDLSTAPAGLLAVLDPFQQIPEE